MKKTTILFLLAIFPYLVFAEGSSEADDGLRAIAAAIAIAIGAMGGALGQGKLAAAAMEGIARNPQASKSMFIPFMIGLGLIESLVIYCLIVSMSLI